MSWCYPGGLQILTGHQLMVKLSTWCHLDKRGPKTALSTMSLIKNSPTCPGLQYIHLLEFLGSRSKSSPDILHQLLDVDLFIVERLLNSRSGGDPVVNPGMSGRFPRCGHFSRSLHYVEKERGPSLTSLFLQFCPPLLTHCPPCPDIIQHGGDSDSATLAVSHLPPTPRPHNSIADRVLC